jgi:protease-4
LSRLQGGELEGIRRRDLLAVLDAAGRDDQITLALLVLDSFAGAGLPTLNEVATAMERFKAKGKPVYAWGGNYDQRQYFLAAHANEVWLHPMGSVLVEGYGRYRSYYRDLRDRVGVTANVVRAGSFKNAFETFAANGPSPETQASDGALYDARAPPARTPRQKALGLAEQAPAPLKPSSRSQPRRESHRVSASQFAARGPRRLALALPRPH